MERRDQRTGLLLAGVSLVSQLMAQTGPAGIGTATNNVLWLRADRGVYTNAGTTPAANGDNVYQWSDGSGNNKNALQTTLAKRPNYITSAVNSYPALRFTQANADHFTTTGITSGNQASAWVVARYASLPSSNPGLLQGAATGNALSSTPGNKNLGMWVSNAAAVWGRGIQSDGTSKNVPATTTLSANTWYVLNGNYDGTNIVQYVNNAAAGTVSYDGTLRSWTDVAIGVQAGTENWNGDIAEVILFNTALNAAQRIILGNYLSAKYGTTLGANDLYTNDDPVRGDFDHEVAGIGQISATDFQKDSRGSSVVRISNPSGLNNGEFLIWGHNNGWFGTGASSDYPPTVQGRWGRVWRVNEVDLAGNPADVGAVDMVFDLSGLGTVNATQLRLLVDTDNDGAFADETPISGATSVGGGSYKFAAVTALADGRRFTLATTSIAGTPLPIELLGFSATRESATRVRLDWATASEHDNDRFTVERSTDVTTWSPILEVPGAGNSTSVLAYSAQDEAAPAGDLYYRLRQTDTDGTTTVSDIRYVGPGGMAGADLLLYPNPASGSFQVGTRTRVDGPMTLTLLDGAGRTVAERRLDPQSAPASFDVAALPEGLYHLRVQRTDRVEMLSVSVMH
ncbi:MAG: hypothetical protein JST66_15830 [Bacteroidetes bacterium]|nr:hypothetical protein [Bacteroidota bacterium]